MGFQWIGLHMSCLHFTGPLIFRDRPCSTCPSPGWESDSAQESLIAQAAKSVGDFPLTTPDDSALLVTLPAGLYTAQVSGADGGTGIAIVEAYLVPAGN